MLVRSEPFSRALLLVMATTMLVLPVAMMPGGHTRVLQAAPATFVMM